MRRRRWCVSALAAAAVVAVPSCEALRRGAAPSRSRAVRRRVGPRMCICVHCALVDRCTAYHVVEAKHSQPHVSSAPDFTPRDQSPTVAINVFGPNSALADRGVEVELDVVACADFAEERGRWSRMMPAGTLVAAGFDPDFLPT